MFFAKPLGYFFRNEAIEYNRLAIISSTNLYYHIDFRVSLRTIEAIEQACIENSIEIIGHFMNVNNNAEIVAGFLKGSLPDGGILLKAQVRFLYFYSRERSTE